MDSTTTPPIVPATPSAPIDPQPNIADANSEPVMDILVQQAPADDKPAEAEATPSTPNVPTDDQTITTKAIPAKLKPAAKQSHVSDTSAAAQGSGVGLAIIATVVIILSLAGLAVYAYLQTK